MKDQPSTSAVHDECGHNSSRRILMLASASPARRTTLQAAHIGHCVMVSTVDEDAVLSAVHKEAGRDLTAPEQVKVLAREKACDVAQRILEAGNPQGVAVVVGCDSMFELDGKVVGKPHSPEVARERLRRMSAHAGKLYTGHCLIDMANPAAMVEEVSAATVFIAPLSDEDIEAYIASGEPLEVAGSFTVDGRGGPFVDRIEGDYHGVVGISLPLVRVLLGRLGYSITDFWVE